MTYDDSRIFALLQKANDCIAEIETAAPTVCAGDQIGEQRLERLNYGLADAITNMAKIPAEGCSAAWKAKMLAARNYLREIRDDAFDGPGGKLIWSALDDLFPSV